MPQPPQLALSLPLVLTQPPLHIVGNDALPQLDTQTGGVPSQATLPFAGVVHREQVRPHDRSDVELSATQVPPQSWVPPGHRHDEFWQVIPPAHWVGQPPQWFGSLVMSTQIGPFDVLHAVPFRQTHVPLRHDCVLGQAVPHAPQLPLSVVTSTQRGGVPQSFPEAIVAQRTQPRATQVAFGSQAFPHPPQLP
jgi:hypothetical protein